MYEITVKGSFSAAHHIEGYPGDCAKTHGHNWTVSVTVACRRLDASGLGIDFRTVRAALRETISDFDHRYLNDLPCFAETNPTSENIATKVFREMSRRINRSGVDVSSVTVSESPDTGVCYRPDPTPERYG